MPAIPVQQRKPRPAPRREAISVALGKRIKTLRIAADRSQAELAFDCELDRTYISLVERGLANPSLWTLGTLAYALNTNVAELLQGNTNIVKPSMGASDRKRRVNQASHEAKRPAGSRRSQLR
ncbi:helix-turn-helix domain-containing protein [Variovorax sp. N23]|uniref:helix-turn-helix domain-containing protein n=1 Tax=Variovorax sp. N23 TaxID=2980555 RepID=UPI0021C8B34A|nr:helix-turn-helix transcriptional regulator [Variovorax sp. N23]MCU4119131.1 helix-turn-helix domain-containing protein [Variovorax sp. N23]